MAMGGPAIKRLGVSLEVFGKSCSCAGRNPVSALPYWMKRGPGLLPAQEYVRSEEHTSELQSLMRISYAVFCLKKKKTKDKKTQQTSRRKIQTAHTKTNK